MKIKKEFRTVIILVLLLLLTACADTQSQSSDSAEGTDSSSVKNAPAETVKEGVTIFYHTSAQFELVDSDGNRVLMDIRSPENLTSAATSSDILLTTNTQYRTYVQEFVDSFPGEQLFLEAGEIKTPDVSITGIASGINPAEDVANASRNFIYIIEMGGLRIANLGQIGQEEFSQDQLALLGEVDVVLTHFVNSFSTVNTQNQIVFNLMDQLNPKLIIPTFGSGNMDMIELAAEKWSEFATANQSVSVSASIMSNETQFLIMGENAENMKSIFDIPEWDK